MFSYGALTNFKIQIIYKFQHTGSFTEVRNPASHAKHPVSTTFLPNTVYSLPDYTQKSAVLILAAVRTYRAVEGPVTLLGYILEVQCAEGSNASGERCSVVVKALCISRKVAGSNPDEVPEIIHFT
jgi:hypothetical protein